MHSICAENQTHLSMILKVKVTRVNWNVTSLRRCSSSAIVCLGKLEGLKLIQAASLTNGTSIKQRVAIIGDAPAARLPFPTSTARVIIYELRYLDCRIPFLPRMPSRTMNHSTIPDGCTDQSVVSQGRLRFPTATQSLTTAACYAAWHIEEHYSTSQSYTKNLYAPLGRQHSGTSLGTDGRRLF